MSGPGGTGKSHVLKMIQRDMRCNVSNCDPVQPTVLITAPTGSTTYQIGGSTIDSTFLLYEKGKNKPSWEKRTIMQVNLQNVVLVTTDEISIVGYKKFLDMNKTMCTIKGSYNADWGNICVLAVGNLYQLPPVGQSPIYKPPKMIHSLNNFDPNGWEKMKLHELTQTMWQKDSFFAKCLNKIHMTVPDIGSVEDVLLQQCEVKVEHTQPKYMRNAMHVFAQNKYCDEWKEFMLKSLPWDTSICVACDSKKDNITNLADINIPDKPSATGNLTKELKIKIGARVMITTNIDVSDGLTNGVMGTIVNILKYEEEVNVKVILVKFDNSDVGQSAKSQSLYKKVNRNAVPVFHFRHHFR